MTPSAEFSFDEDDLTEVVATMDRLTAAGAGWINFVPDVEDGYQPPHRGVIAGIFSARGEAIPLATWSAPGQTADRPHLGIEHGSGPRALPRLEERDLGLGERWFKVADHPRRGLVVTAPTTAADDDVLWWLLASSHALSVVPLTGNWHARVYEPATKR